MSDLEALLDHVRASEQQALECAIQAKQHRIASNRLYDGESGDCACAGCVPSRHVIGEEILARLRDLEARGRQS